MKTGPYLGDEPTPWQLQFTESVSKISTVNHGKDVAKPRSCQRHQSKQQGLPLWTPSGGRWEEMSAGHCQSHTSAFFPFLWKKVVSTRYAFLLFFSHIYVTRESNPSRKKPKTSIVQWAFPSLKWDKWASITTSAKGGPDLRGSHGRGLNRKFFGRSVGKGSLKVG